MERLISKMPVKEIDKHPLGRRICKINHQEAAIKAARTVMLRALLSASLTLQPHQLPDAVHCVSPDCWTGSAGARLATGMRWAAETDANFFPEKTAE